MLEREAQYRAGAADAGRAVRLPVRDAQPQPPRLRRRPDGMAGDPLYDADWRGYLEQVRRQVGAVDFADMVYVRSDLYVAEERRQDPDYEPPVPPLFGEKEGKIARANRGRDPLYLFAALQRQLGYPEVPRPRQRDDLQSQARGDCRQSAGDGNAAATGRRRSARAGRSERVRGKPELLKDDDEQASRLPGGTVFRVPPGRRHLLTPTVARPERLQHFVQVVRDATLRRRGNLCSQTKFFALGGATSGSRSPRRRGRSAAGAGTRLRFARRVDAKMAASHRGPPCRRLPDRCDRIRPGRRHDSRV